MEFIEANDLFTINVAVINGLIGLSILAVFFGIPIIVTLFSYGNFGPICLSIAVTSLLVLGGVLSMNYADQRIDEAKQYNVNLCTTEILNILDEELTVKNTLLILDPCDRYLTQIIKDNKHIISNSNSELAKFIAIK